MAWFSFAEKRPIGINYGSGGNYPRLLIVHTIVGSLSSADNWFRNPKARVSAHFGVGKDGRIVQWVNTSDRAWANVSANSISISIENEGQTNEPLTDAQVEANARIYAEAAKVHGISLTRAASATGSGIGYHSQFSSWSGGGTACPGPKRVAQIPAVLSRAKEIFNGSPVKPPATGGSGNGSSTPKPTPKPTPATPSGITTTRSYIKQQSAINDLRYILGHATRVTQDDKWGPETQDNVQWLQKVVGAEADSKWGPDTEKKFNEYVKSKGSPKRFAALKVDGAEGPKTIKALQIYLGVKSDGKLGPVTVRKLQKKIGATQDGIWGSGTTRRLQWSINEGVF
jgi:hypothetical protein